MVSLFPVLNARVDRLEVKVVELVCGLNVLSEELQSSQVLSSLDPCRLGVGDALVGYI